MAEHSFTIKIDDDQLIEAVAASIISKHQPEYDDEGEVIESTRYRVTIEDRVRQTVDKMVRGAVEDSVKRITEDHISAAVAAVIAEGWQKTDNYGSVSGPKMSIKDRISETLTKLQGDGYSSNRKNLVDATIEGAVQAALKTEFGKVIDEAREKFKAQIDSVVSAKLNETLKSALGLR